MDSTEQEIDYESYVTGMPLDDTLLEDLGRLNWAAARLHHAIRDAINEIDGAPSDDPFADWSLGKALGELNRRAEVLGTDEGRRLSQWCRQTRGAVQGRNGIVHAVAYTDKDGAQALRTLSGAGRVTVHLLRVVTGMLVHAASTMPPVR
jgi:hypothetical protein